MTPVLGASFRLASGSGILVSFRFIFSSLHSWDIEECLGCMILAALSYGNLHL
jgi:hypothetical protein